MIKGIIFDLDGTLLDTLEDLANSVNEALAEMQQPLRTLEEVRAFVGNGVKVLTKRALPEEKREDSLLHEQVLAHFTEIYARRKAENTEPYPGILDALETLALTGFKLGVLSNKPDDAVKPLCEKYFGTRFSVLQGTTPEGKKKPDPEGLLKIVEAWALSPSEVIYVGDSEVDIETSKRAGIRCIAVTWGFRDEDYLSSLAPEAMVSDAQELVAYCIENQ